MAAKPAVVRFYIDADVLGLAKVLARLGSDVTYPGGWREDPQAPAPRLPNRQYGCRGRGLDSRDGPAGLAHHHQRPRLLARIDADVDPPPALAKDGRSRGSAAVGGMSASAGRRGVSPVGEASGAA